MFRRRLSTTLGLLALLVMATACTGGRGEMGIDTKIILGCIAAIVVLGGLLILTGGGGKAEADPGPSYGGGVSWSTTLVVGALALAVFGCAIAYAVSGPAEKITAVTAAHSVWSSTLGWVLVVIVVIVVGLLAAKMLASGDRRR